MLKKFLPNWLTGVLVSIVLFANVIIWGTLVLLFGVLKLILPFKVVSDILHAAYRGWCKGNRLALWLGCPTIDVDIKGKVSTDGWYLLISNHMSWLDIVVLSAIDVLPAPKFFLKDELKYVPFIGTGAWAMGMPFMKRVSKAQLAKNPKLKGLDVERTKRSCRDFRNHPTTIINFVEGTRFTCQKHKKQNSPFTYLLKPKAGGIAFALEVLGEQFDALLNTSIIYQGEGDHICRNLMRGRLNVIKVEMHVQAISAEMIGDYQHDRAFRTAFQQHINELWLQKDAQLLTYHQAQQAEYLANINKEVEAP
ncbi:acyltransferase [Pseudoalteromonas elyakovii]|uniref:acyltransferase n=1 Tax=Pseudoalteromonas shioyasakiensis TaxID=1190813 RepID=UPI0022B105E7|nr:acyltransferase [Pseudoalteromonas shioyasakiensis]MCZ4251328.1 acyltransferase [Pseudoalteromonas shioyasakiensis]MDC3190219.1 acyltransferase [Pseudoalteromonas elyakovii]